jgi:AcrR family transcriptional regulator
MKSDLLAPKQQRSRETLVRLLRATVATLEEHGLEGTTIPRVAAAAGIAPATVYRRFRDKDALYRAVFLMLLEKSVVGTRKVLRAQAAEARTLEGAVEKLVAIMIRQYRDHPGLLRALIRFVETDEDASFKKKALAHLAGNIATAGDVLLAFRKQIARAAPERAVLFGLLSVATVLEVRALEPVSMWRELLPISDKQMQSELSGMLLAYLRSRERLVIGSGRVERQSETVA